jgi:hypothetical protein
VFGDYTDVYDYDIRLAVGDGATRPLCYESRIVKQPLYFSTERGISFGWLHRPAGDSCSDIGVVICKPFG